MDAGSPLDEVIPMVAVLFAVLVTWFALALVLGVWIGKAIHRADSAEFPDRAQQLPATGPVPAGPPAPESSPAVGGPGLLAA